MASTEPIASMGLSSFGCSTSISNLWFNSSKTPKRYLQRFDFFWQWRMTPPKRRNCEMKYNVVGCQAAVLTFLLTEKNGSEEIHFPCGVTNRLNRLVFAWVCIWHWVCQRDAPFAPTADTWSRMQMQNQVKTVFHVMWPYISSKSIIRNVNLNRHRNLLAWASSEKHHDR